MPEFTVPLEALKAERKKNKEKIKNLEEKMQDLLNATPELGENAEDEESNAPIDSTIPEASTPNLLSEFADLVQNPYYSDSAEHIDEILEYASSHDVPLKIAYNSLFAESKYESLRQKSELDALASLQLKASKKVEAVDGGSGTAKKSINLTSDQLDAASACHMTPEEYARWM